MLPLTLLAPSGGVVACVRQASGLRLPIASQGGSIASPSLPHRAMAAIMDIPGDVSICLFSVYYRDGIRMTGDSLTLAAEVGQHAAAASLPILVGTDHNMHPWEEACAPSAAPPPVALPRRPPRRFRRGEKVRGEKSLPLGTHTPPTERLLHLDWPCHVHHVDLVVDH